MPIVHVRGDATHPVGPGPYLLPHVCNDAGGWGRGYVLALSRRWAAPEIDYRRWYDGDVPEPFVLGQVRFVPTDAHLVVANIIAQHGYASPTNPCPLDYRALAEGLQSIDRWLDANPSTVHMPKIGSGLAGGDWPRVEQLVVEHLGRWSVTVYTP
jgi:O-acetyl-ADP-ribose deacetylase (regulator of RNase III)